MQMKIEMSLFSSQNFVIFKHQKFNKHTRTWDYGGNDDGDDDDGDNNNNNNNNNNNFNININVNFCAF
jgi:hypothetical protein